MIMKRLRASCALLTALALGANGCTGGGEPESSTDTQALVSPPCVELPATVTYQVTNRAWRSEAAAIANQTEFAQNFNMDSNLSVAHGPASANLGMQVMRESEWSSTSMKLVIKAVYTYDVIMVNPDTAKLSQTAYDLIKPPAAGDTQALRDARARAFLKTCGRYDAGPARGADRHRRCLGAGRHRRRRPGHRDPADLVPRGDPGGTAQRLRPRLQDQRRRSVDRPRAGDGSHGHRSADLAVGVLHRHQGLGQ